MYGTSSSPFGIPPRRTLAYHGFPIVSIKGERVSEKNKLTLPGGQVTLELTVRWWRRPCSSGG